MKPFNDFMHRDCACILELGQSNGSCRIDSEKIDVSVLLRSKLGISISHALEALAKI